MSRTNFLRIRGIFETGFFGKQSQLTQVQVGMEQEVARNIDMFEIRKSQGNQIAAEALLPMLLAGRGVVADGNSSVTDQECRITGLRLSIRRSVWIIRPGSAPT